jgi:hypothetical protein
MTPSRYHAWQRVTEVCGLDDRRSFPRSMPSRVTREEVARAKVSRRNSRSARVPRSADGASERPFLTVRRRNAESITREGRGPRMGRRVGATSAPRPRATLAVAPDVARKVMPWRMSLP